MDIFFTIAGLAIGISAFLYLINALDAGKRRYRAVNRRRKISATHGAVSAKKASGTARPQSTGGLKTVQALPDDYKDMIAQRVCPICAHILSRDEPLYASHIEVGKERKVLIYGCSYCYKGEKRKD